MKAFLAVLLLGAALATPVTAFAQGARNRPNIENFKDADRAAARVTRLAIVQDYEPDPAIWLLQDEDTRIYLLGTVHVLPEGFRWRSPRLDGIVAQADELVLESLDEDDESAIADLLASLEQRPRVSERLSPENGPKWLTLAEIAGMEPDEFDRLPPLLGVFGIGITLLSEETGADRAYGVETVLSAEFGAAGKPIGGLENPAQVLASLLAVDEALLIEELDQDLARWDGESLVTLLSIEAKEGWIAPEDQVLADEHAWAQGREIDVGEDFFGDTEFGRIVTRILLDDRNRAWTDWLERRLATPGSVLVAVGAAHLSGKNSVQAFLLERGLAAERLD